MRTPCQRMKSANQGILNYKWKVSLTTSLFEGRKKSKKHIQELLKKIKLTGL
jgi:hypothetical protein